MWCWVKMRMEAGIQTSEIENLKTTCGFTFSPSEAPPASGVDQYPDTSSSISSYPSSDCWLYEGISAASAARLSIMMSLWHHYEWSIIRLPTSTVSMVMHHGGVSLLFFREVIHLTVLGPSTDHSLTVTQTNILMGEREEGEVIMVHQWRW